MGCKSKLNTVFDVESFYTNFKAIALKMYYFHANLLGS